MLVQHPQRELRSLLTGSATFVEDLSFSGQLHVGFLRSPLAHARIRAIDTNRASRMDGVVEVFTRSDLQDLLRPDVWREYPLAQTEVVYQGQPVAAVAATRRECLEDCLESIGVDYEPLPVVSDPAKAFSGKDLWLSTAASNVILRQESRAGRPEEVLGKSPHRLDLRFAIPRISPYPLEGRGLVIERRPRETVAYSSTQSPNQLQQFLISSTAEQGSVRVIQTAVGGAFGGKIFAYAEDLACYLVSVKLRRDVKWVPLPEEKLVTLTHRPNQTHRVRVGYDDSGRVLALKDEVTVDAGAHFEGSAGGSMHHPGTELGHGSTPGHQMVSMFTGPYDIRDVEISVATVATNKVMMGPIRGSGGMIATFILERVMNQIALRLGLDQFSVRKVNLIGADSSVYHTPFGGAIPQLRLPDLLERARTSPLTRETVRRSSSRGGSKLMGAGLSFYLSESAPPSEEPVRLELTKHGNLRLFTSVAPSGQGSERTLAAMVSGKLKAGRSSVEVRFGDTTTSRPGVGTYSSRSITYAGSAALIACRLLVERVKELLLVSRREAPAAVGFRAGVFHLRYRDGHRRDLDFIDVAQELGDEVTVDATYKSETSTFSSGCHISLVEVDGETGSVRVRKHLTFDDFGKVLDLAALTAQTEGGAMQSIGETTEESVEYDGQGRLNGLYAIPSPRAAPSFSHTPVRLTTSQHVHGARGAGEAGRIGSLPAIVNAVENALSGSGKAVFLASLPATDESNYSLAQRS